MTLNQSRISKISWCTAVPPASLDSSVVLATGLHFAAFKFLVVDPEPRNLFYFFALFKNKRS